MRAIYRFESQPTILGRACASTQAHYCDKPRNSKSIGPYEPL